jgi:hypothetical protein
VLHDKEGRDGLRLLARVLMVVALLGAAWMVATTRLVAMAAGCGWDGASYCAMSEGGTVAAPFSHRVLVPWLAHLVPGLSPAVRFEVVDAVAIAAGALLLATLVSRLALRLGAPAPRASAAGMASAALFLLSPWTVHASAWAPALTDPVANALLFGWMLAVLSIRRRWSVSALALAAAAVLAREASLPVILVAAAALLVVERRHVLSAVAASGLATVLAGAYVDTRPSVPSSYSASAEISRNLSSHFAHAGGLLRLGWMVVFAVGFVPLLPLLLRGAPPLQRASWRRPPAPLAVLLATALATAALALVGGSDTSRLLFPGAVLVVGAALALVAAHPVPAPALWAAALATVALWQPWHVLGPAVAPGEDFFPSPTLVPVAPLRPRWCRPPPTPCGDAPGRSAAALRSRGGRGGGGHRHQALRVGEDGVDLPAGAVGVADPDLVLHRVAAGDVLLDVGGHPLAAQPPRRRGDLVGGLHLHAQVVEGAARLLRVLDEHQLEGRVGDGEVGVAGTTLGGLGAEELAVEVDGGLQVGDVEGELDTGHGARPPGVTEPARSLARTYRRLSMRWAEPRWTPPPPRCHPAPGE